MMQSQLCMCWPFKKWYPYICTHVTSQQRRTFRQTYIHTLDTWPTGQNLVFMWLAAYSNTWWTLSFPHTRAAGTQASWGLPGRSIPTWRGASDNTYTAKGTTFSSSSWAARHQTGRWRGRLRPAARRASRPKKKRPRRASQPRVRERGGVKRAPQRGGRARRQTVGGRRRHPAPPPGDPGPRNKVMQVRAQPEARYQRCKWWRHREGSVPDYEKPGSRYRLSKAHN